MERIGVREARQHLSVYLARVKQGESFVVTEHGRVVASLGPPPNEQDPLGHLVLAGLVSPSAHGRLPDPVTLPPGPDLGQLLEDVRSDREL